MLDCNVSFNYPVPLTDDSIFYRNNSCYKRAKYSQPRRNHDDRQRREMPAFNERETFYNSQYLSRPTCCCRLALVLLCVLFAQRGLILNTNLARLDSNFLSLNILTIGMLVGAAPTAHLDPTVRAERSANLSHITGASRKIQMYIKNRHLQILPDGTVNGSTDDSSDYTILQRTSVSRGQLRIQGVATCLFLCMDSCGLLYGSKEYIEDCLFNETIEQHNYNTYSSVRWSTTKKTLYLGLNRHGVPRRVQAKGHNLGRLSAYARVLTQIAPMDRVEALQKRMSSQHNIRHQFNGRHQYYNFQQLQQYVCPIIVQQVQNNRDRLRCRKKKNKKKISKQYSDDSLSNLKCNSANSTVEQNFHKTKSSQSKKLCQLFKDQHSREDVTDLIARKRKSRIERKLTSSLITEQSNTYIKDNKRTTVDNKKKLSKKIKKVDDLRQQDTKEKSKILKFLKNELVDMAGENTDNVNNIVSTKMPSFHFEQTTSNYVNDVSDASSKYLDITMDTISSEMTEENFSSLTVLKSNEENGDWDSSETEITTNESEESTAM